MGTECECVCFVLHVLCVWMGTVCVREYHAYVTVRARAVCVHERWARARVCTCTIRVHTMHTCMYTVCVTHGMSQSHGGSDAEEAGVGQVDRFRAFLLLCCPVTET